VHCEKSRHHIPNSSVEDAQIRQQALAVQLQYDIAFPIAALPAGALAPCRKRSYRAIRARITRCNVHKQTHVLQYRDIGNLPSAWLVKLLIADDPLQSTPRQALVAYCGLYDFATQHTVQQ
jgi:hypothetical protein